MYSSKLIEDPKLKDRVYVFKDRVQAGEVLATRLRGYSGSNGIVLAIPSGGVPVGYSVAKALRLPFDLAVARKIFIPGTTEAGYGGVSWDGEVALNHELIAVLGLTSLDIKRGVEEVKRVLEARLKKFRGSKPLPELEGKLVIIVDDGLASGYTMLACVKSVRKRKPARIVVAVPTGSVNAVNLVLPEVDELVCLNVRGGFTFAVADAYEQWYDLTDEEVIGYLRRAASDLQ